MVPERNFAIISMTNCGPNGPELNDGLVRWALEHYIGVIDKEPETVLLGDEALAAYVGRYETIAATVDVTAEAGRLVANVQIKPEMLAVLREAGEENHETETKFLLAMLATEGDRYTIPEGPAKGMKGYFTRAADGSVDAVHVGGRLATRTATVPA
jgi:hypothetical protein